MFLETRRAGDGSLTAHPYHYIMQALLPNIWYRTQRLLEEHCMDEKVAVAGLRVVYNWSLGHPDAIGALVCDMFAVFS